MKILLYLAARLAEGSTLRGLLIFLGSALGLSVTEQDWDVVYQAIQVLSGAASEMADPESRFNIALGTFMHLTSLTGVIGMLTPDHFMSDRLHALMDWLKTKHS